MNTIELQGVGVRYRRERFHHFKEFLLHGLNRSPAQYFYSLRNINLAIANGESVGIIGSNGAGKSTLLRVASGIVTPSEGVAIGRGNIVPVLELGTGFEAELSGRENIHFNGALLGRSREWMRRHLDAIVAFSELDAFIDQPLRTYSMGMVARLAFAIATSVDAETILLDEIFAVGDASFRTRCEERIQSFVREGRTVVLVSHDTKAVMDICRRTVWISHGEIVADGPSEEVVPQYEEHSGGRKKG